jgi:uncharacterized membrane protein
MAGIGFELRRLLRDRSFLGLLRGYGYAGLITSGPWVFSIMGVMVIGLLSVGRILPSARVAAFLVSINYLMAASLMFTGGFQILFTRYISDRLYEKRDDQVIPNLAGALTVVGVSGAVVSGAILAIFFKEDLVYKLLMVGNFVTLCEIWIVVVLVSGLRVPEKILASFFIGYALSVGGALALRSFGINGLLAGFLFGQTVMFYLMLAVIIQNHPLAKLVQYGFLDRGKVYLSLAATGFFFNAGIWADKFIFWMNPETSSPVIGPLRSSIVYDLPIFIAYLSIIPGMAVFLVRIETDFAEQYEAFYGAVRDGDTLRHIQKIKASMVYTIRQGIYEILKVQGLTVLLLLMAGPAVLRMFGISHLYLPLYQVDLVGVGVQVVMLATFNVFFYLDQRLMALLLSILFVVSNIGLTLITQSMGPMYYGYGFALAVSLTSFVGLVVLSRKLRSLEVDTFMMAG